MRSSRAAAIKGLRLVGSAIFDVRTELVLVKPLATAAPRENPEGLDAEFVDAPDLEWLASLPDTWRADAFMMATFRCYIANRFGCLLVKERGVPIGYVWWTCREGGVHGPHPHIARLGITLADSDAWFFDLYVSPEHRGKGKPAACLRLAENEGLRRGLRRVMFCVLETNRPARGLYSRLGWKVEATETSVVVGQRLMICRFGIFLHAGWRRPYGFDFAPLLRWMPQSRGVTSSAARVESRSWTAGCGLDGAADQPQPARRLPSRASTSRHHRP